MPLSRKVKRKQRRLAVKAGAVRPKTIPRAHRQKKIRTARRARRRAERVFSRLRAAMLQQ